MRFQRLQIPAFGPFTNLDLGFPDQPADLHVIYGPNEAGKSSLLRAIRDLLFGIHSQSADNFLHDYADLRIRGEIRNRAGQQLVFQRRKGNKNTLLDANGDPLPESALAPFLGSVDATYFSAMFGLGARELRDGAQQLLRGEGDIGAALFSASMGGTPVQKVIEALESEADQIFKGRATANVSIRPAANRYKDLLRQSREAVVNPETWERIERELAEAVGSQNSLEQEIAKLEGDLLWISRCEDALPTVGRLQDARQKLGQLPPLPELASDFVSRARAARTGVTEAHAELKRRTDQLEKLRGQLQPCKTLPAVLLRAEALDRLHQDVGAYKAHRKARADLQNALAGIEPALRAGMLNLQLSGEFVTLETHRLSSPVRLQCEEAARALKEALAAQVANSGEAEKLRNQIRIQEEQLRLLPETDLTSLREALAVAAEATQADRSYSSSESEVKHLTREVTSQHRQVFGAPADFDATAGLPVPAATTIRRYHEQMESLRRNLRAEEEKSLDADQRANAIQAELGRLQRQGELPSAETLRQAREHRDHGWTLVLADWKGEGAPGELVPGTPLEHAFPASISKADGIADQLWLHAEAVAQAEEKRFQLRACQKQAAEARRLARELQGAIDACRQAWQGEWAACGITPRLPDEMLEWRDQWTAFRTQLEKLKAAQDSLEGKGLQIAQARKRLAVALNQSEAKEFSLLFAAAKKLVQDGEQAAGRRLEKTAKLAECTTELAGVEQSRAQLSEAVSTATEAWKAQCAGVGLPADTSPDAGLTLLQERKELLAKFDEWRKASAQSRLEEDAIGQYDQRVRAEGVALGVAADTTESLEYKLWELLTSARTAQAQYDQLAERIQDVSRELDAARLVVADSEESLNGLLRLAGLTAVAEMEPLLDHLEKSTTLREQIEDWRSALVGLARGQNVDDFVARVLAENPDTLPSRKSTATRYRDEKQGALSEGRETLFRLRNEKQGLERAGDAAADLCQQAASAAAALQADAARFLRLRLATHLLQRQIERFRKDNQGPLLQKSGDVFQAITRGAFSGLGAEFNADDLPVLVGVRRDHSKVAVEGLSEGSRDQLFLALRLAALDRHLEEHEPMPLILDDLLITFDDERAKAILPQLGAMAQRTQIVLFTHHEHLVELCRQRLGAGKFHLHRLSSA